MSGSILGKLSKGSSRVKEHQNSNEQMRLIRSWVKAHELEIRSAKERGYTWREITRACIEMLEHNREFRGVYMRKDESLIQECYYDAKYGRRTKHEGKGKVSSLRELSGSIRLSED